MKSIKTLSTLLRVASLPLFVFAFMGERYLDAAVIILAAIYVHSVVRFFYKRENKFVLYLDIFLTVVVFLDMLGFAYFFESPLTPWYDEVMHLFGGVAGGVMMFVLVFLEDIFGKIKASNNTIGILMFFITVAGATSWELFEYFMDRVFSPAVLMQSDPSETPINDTMNDIIIGCVGGVIVSIGCVKTFLGKKGYGVTGKQKK